MLAIITPNEKRNFDNKIIIIHGRNFFFIMIIDCFLLKPHTRTLVGTAMT